MYIFEENNRINSRRQKANRFMIFKTVKITETWFFLLITIISLIPVLAFTFFPTLDGAAHLYNARLIQELIFNKDSFLQPFHTFNPEPVPNWTGHAVLVFFHCFLPGYLVEKVLLVLIIFGLAYSFRFLVRVISSGNVQLSYLVFPFTYTFVFYMGFYNFCIALVCLFTALACWIKYYPRLTFLRSVFLCLLVFATYFSHLFVFGILLLCMGLYIISCTIREMVDQGNKAVVWRDSLKKTGVLILISLLPLCLSLLYFSSRPPFTPHDTYLSWAELFKGIKYMRPKIALRGEETSYTKKLVWLIAALFAMAFYKRIRAVNFKKDASFGSKIKSAFQKLNGTDLWLFVAGILLLLYFYLPDSNAISGFISVRTCLLFFFFLVLWLSLQSYPKWVVIGAVAVTLYFHLRLIKGYYYRYATDLNEVAVQCHGASRYIRPNSSILTLNYSKEWMLGHVSNVSIRETHLEKEKRKYLFCVKNR
jgi:hypothetical protein